MGMSSKAVRGLLGSVAALLMLAAACTSSPGEPGASGGGDRPDGPVVGIASSAPTLLRSAASCDDVVEGMRALAAESAASGGFFGGGFNGDDMAVEESADSAAPVAGAADGAGGGDRSSDTNTQEEGIDEPDIVETDGEHVYVVDQAGESGERLVILDGATAEVLSRTDLPSWGNTLLLSEDRLLVISGGGHSGFAGGPVVVDDAGGEDPVDPPADVPIPVEPPDFDVGTMLQLFDVSDPAAPQVVSTTEIEGSHNSTRVVDGVARVVVSSYPAVHPMLESVDFDDADAVERATEDAIADADVSDWLPSYRTSTPDGDGGVTSEQGDAVSCDQVLIPDVNAGVGETSILRVDFDSGFDPSATTTVVADAHTVYASAQTLYIAATRYWSPNTDTGGDVAAEDWATAIHAFDLTGAGGAAHVAAGEVPGNLLNQYSMSEHGGDLRVATTEGVPWGDAADSQSGVRVLRRTGDQLAEIGSVTGLGVTETIQSVRFMGDVGYVVTFRQTDPLYVIDLADPTAPRAVGELKIPGFSSYLHPIGDGRLLGIGRDADPETGADRGFLLSLFDVSDHAAPAQIQTFTDPAVHSGAAWDPKAFLWWAPENAVIVPFERFDERAFAEPAQGDEFVEPTYDSGLLVFDVADSGITVRGSIVTPSGGESGAYTQWSRGLIVQDRLWGLYSQWGPQDRGSGGVAVASFDDLDSPTLVLFS